MCISQDVYKRQDYNIVYVDGEKFTNEIISAIHDNTTAEFHNKYRAADVLLVDDIQDVYKRQVFGNACLHVVSSPLSFNEMPKEIVRKKRACVCLLYTSRCV